MTRSRYRKSISFVGPNERTVDAADLKRALMFPWRLRRGVTLKATKKNGKPVGYKVRALRSNHPLYLLGARKGDVIRSVNGYALRNPDEALEAFKALRSESDLKFTLVRSGEEEEFVVHIRERHTA
jgi:type II secretory pathway component PulC